MVALHIIDPDVDQDIQYLLRLHEFRDRLEPELMGDLHYGTDEDLIFTALVEMVDKAPVHLDLVHGQVLEIGERRVARAEVVQREFEPLFFHAREKALGLGDFQYGGGFRDLEHDPSGAHPAVDHLPLEVVAVIRNAQRAAREVHGNAAILIARLGQGFQHIAQDPFIDFAHLPGVLGGIDELAGAVNTALGVRQPEKGLEIIDVLLAWQRRDGLKIEEQPAFFERILNNRLPVDALPHGLQHRVRGLYK